MESCPLFNTTRRRLTCAKCTQRGDFIFFDGRDTESVYRLKSVNMASLHDGVQTAPLLDHVDEEKETGTHPREMDIEKGGSPEAQDVHALTGVTYIRSIIIVAILTYINMITYMDRFNAAGVLPELQKAFQIDDSVSGLLHTVFMGGFMLSAPVFGYLGDRWNRKYIISVGISLWSILTLGMSFIPNEYFVPLLLMRGLVGATEATVGTIAPSIIADLFVADQRTHMLTIFYFVVPFGCGLGYITGSKVTSAAHGDWHWAFRITPGLGLIAVLLMIFFVKEPPRGAADRKTKKSQSSNHWLSDVKKLIKNPSFMFSTLGFAAVAFVAGAVGLWAPALLQRARISETEPSQIVVSDYNDSLIFGVLTVVSGILGVVLGVEISKRYRRTNPRADPLVCACGMLSSAPFLLLALVFGNINLVATYVFIFFGEMLLTLNWVIVADILLYVVGPTRRSTAQAIQIMLCHLLGDAGSPYFIGLIADAFRRGWAGSPLLMFRSLEYALMTCPFVAVIGGGFFMATALFVEKDREKAEMESED